jgi:hypothetical protein
MASKPSRRSPRTHSTNVKNVLGQPKHTTVVNRRSAEWRHDANGGRITEPRRPVVAR